MLNLTRISLLTLGRRVAETGIKPNSTDIATLAMAAGNAGVSPVLVSILTDDTAPEVVRLRAFERVSCAMSRVTYRTDVAAAA